MKGSIIAIQFLLLLLSVGLLQAKTQLSPFSIKENVEWSKLNAQQLSMLSPLDFQSVTPAQFASIPGPACAGFQRDQLVQLNNAACNGFTVGCMSNIPPVAMSGIAKTCITGMSLPVIGSLSANQFSGLSNDSMLGFTKQQISALNGLTCRGISPSQIQMLGYSIRFESCSGFTPVCLGNLTAAVIQKFDPFCFSEIPAESVKGFLPQMFKYFSELTLSNIGGRQLVQFVKTFGKQFVNVMNQKQLTEVGVPAILEFKSYVENGQIPRIRTVSDDEIADLTWLQLSLSTDDSVLKTLTAANIQTLHKSAVMGFLNNFDQFPANFLLAFTPNQLNYFLSDSVSSFTLEQVETLPPQIFRPPNTMNSNFKYINTKAVRGVTSDQLKALLGNAPGSASDSNLIACQQFNVLTNDQLQLLQPYKIFNILKQQCAKQLKSDPPSKKW